MNAIQKLVESILVKMGFVGAVVENIYLDSKPFRIFDLWLIFQ